MVKLVVLSLIAHMSARTVVDVKATGSQVPRSSGLYRVQHHKLCICITVGRAPCLNSYNVIPGLSDPEAAANSQAPFTLSEGPVEMACLSEDGVT